MLRGFPDTSLCRTDIAVSLSIVGMLKSDIWLQSIMNLEADSCETFHSITISLSISQVWTALVCKHCCWIHQTFRYPKYLLSLLMFSSINILSALQGSTSTNATRNIFLFFVLSKIPPCNSTCSSKRHAYGDDLPIPKHRHKLWSPQFCDDQSSYFRYWTNSIYSNKEIKEWRQSQCLLDLGPR